MSLNFNNDDDSSGSDSLSLISKMRNLHTTAPPLPSHHFLSFKAGSILIKNGVATPEPSRGRLQIEVQTNKIILQFVLRPLNQLQWSMVVEPFQLYAQYHHPPQYPRVLTLRPLKQSQIMLLQTQADEKKEIDRIQHEKAIELARLDEERREKLRYDMEQDVLRHLLESNQQNQQDEQIEQNHSQHQPSQSLSTPQHKAINTDTTTTITMPTLTTSTTTTPSKDNVNNNNSNNNNNTIMSNASVQLSRTASQLGPLKRNYLTIGLNQQQNNNNNNHNNNNNSTNNSTKNNTIDSDLTTTTTTTTIKKDQNPNQSQSSQSTSLFSNLNQFNNINPKLHITNLNDINSSLTTPKHTSLPPQSLSTPSSHAATSTSSASTTLPPLPPLTFPFLNQSLPSLSVLPYMLFPQQSTIIEPCTKHFWFQEEDQKGDMDLVTKLNKLLRPGLDTNSPPPSPPLQDRTQPNNSTLMLKNNNVNNIGTINTTNNNILGTNNINTNETVSNTRINPTHNYQLSTDEKKKLYEEVSLSGNLLLSQMSSNEISLLNEQGNKAIKRNRFSNDGNTTNNDSTTTTTTTTSTTDALQSQSSSHKKQHYNNNSTVKPLSVKRRAPIDSEDDYDDDDDDDTIYDDNNNEQTHSTTTTTTQLTPTTTSTTPLLTLPSLTSSQLLHSQPSSQSQSPLLHSTINNSISTNNSNLNVKLPTNTNLLSVVMENTPFNHSQSTTIHSQSTTSTTNNNNIKSNSTTPLLSTSQSQQQHSQQLDLSSSTLVSLLSPYPIDPSININQSKGTQTTTANNNTNINTNNMNNTNINDKQQLANQIAPSSAKKRGRNVDDKEM